jgi:hypothetical protein
MIQPNRVWHDENLGRAFQNIAQLFAPPDSGDVANYTTAAAKRAEMDRLTALFTAAQNPNFDRERFDRLGVGAGVWSPNQSYYSVDQGNLTTQRGQDIESGDRRYGFDLNRQTALDTNTADNARELEQTRLDNQRAMAQTRFGVIPEGGSLPAMPQSIGNLFGLPALPPERGNVVMSEGQGALGPDGRMTYGPPAILSLEEQKGNFFRDALDVDRRQMMFGDDPVEIVQGPDGRPMFVRRSEAIGMAPAPKTPDTVVNVGAGETKYDQTLGEKQAGDFIALQEGARAAQNKLGLLQGLRDSLAQSAYTGFGADQVLTAKRALLAMGADVGDLGPEETARALGNQLALQLRNPSGGAGMPGALSDRDRDFLVASVPGLAKTPSGNARLLDYLMRVERRSLEVAEFANDYAARNGGRIDQRFYTELNAWAAANPLFPEAAQQQQQQQQPQATPGDAADAWPEGTIIENDNGQRMIRRGGRWEPAQ